MKETNTVKHRHIDDWCILSGASVEIRKQGTFVCSGIVDAVTDDGGILWIHSLVDGRRLFEKADVYQAWVVDERIGFHYRARQGSPECPPSTPSAQRDHTQASSPNEYSSGWLRAPHHWAL